MSRYSILLIGLTAGLIGAIEGTAQVPATLGPVSVLPEAPGRETTKRVCSACHSVEIVAQRRLTRDGWNDVVQLMANHGAVASEAELAEITTYLSVTFPETENKTTTPKDVPSE